MATKDDPKLPNGQPPEGTYPLNSLGAQRAKYGKLIDLNGDEFLLPTYTIKDVYDAIPKHCFERNVWKSLSYVLQDVVGAALTFYVFHKFVIPERVPSYSLRFALW
jgi:omega-6 fatty acid desaturase (delta-12 desaturase)